MWTLRTITAQPIQGSVIVLSRVRFIHLTRLNLLILNCQVHKVVRSGAAVRNDDVQRTLNSPALFDVCVAMSHGEHQSPGQRPDKIDPGSTRYPNQVSVMTQVTPQLHARALSHLRPALQPKGTQTGATTSAPSRLVSPFASAHDAAHRTFVTPPISLRKDFVEPYVPSLGDAMNVDQHRQKGANVRASRCVLLELLCFSRLDSLTQRGMCLNYVLHKFSKTGSVSGSTEFEASTL